MFLGSLEIHLKTQKKVTKWCNGLPKFKLARHYHRQFSFPCLFKRGLVPFVKLILLGFVHLWG